MSSRPPGLFDGISISGFPPLHVNMDEINDQILIHGNSGELHQSQICPCRRLETGMPNAACPACTGTGFLHPPELVCPMIFLDHSRSANWRPNGVGLLGEGTIEVTFPRGTRVAKGDLFLPDGDVSTVQELFHRDVQQVTSKVLAQRRVMPDQLPGRLRPRACRLMYPTVTRIDSLYWIHEGRPVMARQGFDYRLVEGRIEWLTDGPPEASGFSVRYEAPTAYQVFNAVPLHRSEAGNRAPLSVTAQRIDKIQIAADVR